MGRMDYQIETDAGLRVSALESAVQPFDYWCPQVDSSIEALQTSMDCVRTEVVAED